MTTTYCKHFLSTLFHSEVDVGKKICNLRTYYIREMLKRDKAIFGGQASPDSYLPRWPYFDALDAFLQDVVRKKRNEHLTVSWGLWLVLILLFVVD